VLTLIIISTVAFLCSSHQNFQQTPDSCIALAKQGLALEEVECAPQEISVLSQIETVCIIIFTFEYFLRILTAHAMVDTEFSAHSVAANSGSDSDDKPTVGKRDQEGAYQRSGRNLIAQHGGRNYVPGQTTPVAAGAEVELNELNEVDEVAELAQALSLPNTDQMSQDQMSAGVQLRRTWKYMCQPLNVIDLAAIVPFYIELIMGGGGGGLAVLRVLRLARVFRIFRLPTYQQGVHVFIDSLYHSGPALSILFFLSVLSMVLFGAMVYFAEGASKYSVDAAFITEDTPYGVYIRPTINGDGWEPTPFKDMPATFWWVASTMTTVGYGDVFPTSAGGRVVGIFTFLTGIVNLALPVTVVGANFSVCYAKWVSDTAMRQELTIEIEEEEGVPQPLNTVGADGNDDLSVPAQGAVTFHA
jgi:hypothetical protein